MLRLMNFCFVELKGAGTGFFGSLCEVRIRSTSRFSATGVRCFCLTSTVGLTGSAAALTENIGGLIQNQYHQAGTWESAHNSSIWDDSCSLRPARHAFGPNGCGNRRQRDFQSGASESRMGSNGIWQTRRPACTDNLSGNLFEMEDIIGNEGSGGRTRGAAPWFSRLVPWFWIDLLL